MNKNLLAKTVLIIAVLIVFLIGIVGIPSSFTGQGLADSIQKRIHLGLDLKGGTHLILQVQVNDAILSAYVRARFFVAVCLGATAANGRSDRLRACTGSTIARGHPRRCTAVRRPECWCGPKDAPAATPRCVRMDL